MGGPNQLCEIASLKEREGKVWGGTECGLIFFACTIMGFALRYKLRLLLLLKENKKSSI